VPAETPSKVSSAEAATAPSADKPSPPADKPSPPAGAPGLPLDKTVTAEAKPPVVVDKPQAPPIQKGEPLASLGPRPVAAPPRPASIPDIVTSAPEIPTPPPALSPSDLGLQSGGGAARASPPKRITRPPTRRSEPPAPAHIIVPTDVVPSPSKPTPAPAINVMRIIAIGKPTAAAPPELGDADVEEIADADDFDEVTPPQPRVQAVSQVDTVEAASAKAPEPAADAEPTELDDADLAPDSQDGRRPEVPAPTAEAASLQEPVEELGREDALSVPPEAPDFAPVESSSAPQAAPPPPPRRTPSPPQRPDSQRPSRKRALKKPWWEDVFGEDFTRAIPRLSERQIAREVDFIEESLGVAKGGVVLDLGCGSGSHAVELATRGYGVVGYDLSVYQLALAADIAQEREQKINFLQGDMREMAFEETFDGIYCWNTTFGYFEEDKNVAVAERVFKALKPGGMFLVDVANRDYAAQYSPSQLWYEGDSCVCMDDMSLDFITSRLRVKRSLIFDDGRSRECVYSVRLYSLHEIGKILHDVGFRVTEASGHCATPGVFFGEISPRLLVLAQRP
jgi:SAM-dependent methyltransferase